MKIGVTMVAAEGSTQTKILLELLPPGSIYYITIVCEYMATIREEVKRCVKFCKAGGLVPEYFVRQHTTRLFLVCIYVQEIGAAQESNATRAQICVKKTNLK